MNNSDTSSFLPWTVTVILSIVLSQYLNQLFLLQFDFQVHTTHFSKNNKSYKATITNEYHFQVFNGTMNDLPTEEPIIQTQKEVGLTPVQLKDFGLYTKNQYDYSDMDYPVPFNKLVSDITNRYVNYGAKIDSAPFVLTGDIPRFEKQTSEVLMMTGASDNHALGSFNCLFSMVVADPYASYMYIDLGLSPRFRDILFTHFKTIHQIQRKMNSTGFVAYRKFKFSSFPKWITLAGNKQQRGGYAWKVIPLGDAYFAWKGIVFWLDGGSLIREGISRELTNVRLDGIYSPPSSGNQQIWTFPATADFLVRNHLIDRFNPNDPNASGGHLIIDWSNKTVLNKVMIPYYQCAYTQKCMSPRGSSMKNHRQDQAVLSAFLNNLKTKRSLNGSFVATPGLRLESGNSFEKCSLLLGNEVKTIQNTYQIDVKSSYISRKNVKYTKVVTKYSSRPIDDTWSPEK